MPITDFNEKIIIIILIICNVSIFIGHIIYLVKLQKNFNYLLPSWLVILALFLYAQFMPLYMIYAKKDFNINSTFLNVYDFRTFIIVYLVFTAVSILIFLVDVIFKNSLRNKHISISSSSKIENFSHSNKMSFLLTGIIAYFIFLIIFLKDYNYLANMNMNLIFNKTERINNGVLESKISFTNLYMISFVFLLFSYFNFKNIYFKLSIIVLFLLSSSFIFYMGTTLQVLLMIILFLYFAYKFDRKSFKFYLKILVLILPIFWFLVLFSEAYRIYKLNLTAQIDIVGTTNFSTFETVTGYLSGLVVLKSDYIMNEYGLVDFFIGILPNTLVDLLGYDYKSITTLVDNSEMISVFGTYVPTLPISLIPYWYFSIFLFPLIYYFINFMFYILSKGGVITCVFSAILYVDLFYMVRINIEAAIGKARLDIFLLCIFIALYYVINSSIKKLVVTRRG